MSNKLVSTKVMATLLGVSDRVFLRDVIDKDIPCYIVGKRHKFDPSEVRAYLSALRPKVAPVRPFVRKSRTQKSKFAVEAGL